MKNTVLIITGILFFVTIASWSAVMINTGDVFMYLAMARHFTEDAFYLSKDPFLFLNSVMEPHFHHQWLSYFYFYFFNQLWGLTGLIVAKMTLVLAIFTIPVRLAKSTKKLNMGTFGVLSLAVVVMAARIGERAYLFSDLFTILITANLLIFDETRTRKALFFLPLIFLVWVQLHPGFPVGLMVTSLYVILRFSIATREERKTLFLCASLSYAVCTLNPIGFAGFAYPFKIFFSSEWDIYRQINSEWTPFLSSDAIPNESKIVFGSLSLLTLISSVRQALQKNFFPLSVTLIMVYLTWSSMRFSSTSPAVLALLLIATGQPWPKENKLIAGFSFAFVLLLTSYVYQFDNQGLKFLLSDKPKANYSLQAFETLKSLPPGTVFAEWDWNSVLCWMAAEKHKVVVHGHIDRPAFAVQNFLSITRSPEDFDRIVETNQVQYFLLAPETLSDSMSVLSKKLATAPWHLIYQDSRAKLFSR